MPIKSPVSIAVQIVVPAHAAVMRMQRVGPQYWIELFEVRFGEWSQSHQGVLLMCDYSLEHTASRPVKVGRSARDEAIFEYEHARLLPPERPPRWRYARSRALRCPSTRKRVVS
jgi:hypothetical protein